MRAAEASGRAKAGRRFGNRGEEGGLGDGEFARVGVEEDLGGGVDAVGAGAEIGGVEVEFENLVLGQALLELDGEARLLGLAAEGLVGRQDEILHELLGDRGAALNRVAGADVLKQGADDGGIVDAVVGEEALVLDGDEGVDDVRRAIRPGRLRRP